MVALCSFSPGEALDRIIFIRLLYGMVVGLVILLEVKLKGESLSSRFLHNMQSYLCPMKSIGINSIWFCNEWHDMAVYLYLSSFLLVWKCIV